MNFKILHLLYLTAIAAAAFALFNVYGWLWIIFAVAQWMWISKATQCGQEKPRKLYCAVPYFLTTTIIFSTWVGLTQSLQSQFAIDDSNRVSRMRIIGYALEDYMIANGRYPPTYVTDKHGQPMHSWRVLILPFLGQQDLYNQYDFDEPWNGPNNCKLASQLSKDCALFHSSYAQAKGVTPYKLVTGQGTPFEANLQSNPNALRHGASQQILLVEDNLNMTNWMQPVDLSVNQAKSLFGRSNPINQFTSSNPLLKKVTNDFYVCTYDLNVIRVGYLDDTSLVKPFFLNDQPRISSVSELPFVFPASSAAPQVSGLILLFSNAILSILPGFAPQLRLFD